jgi:phenylacetate-CoA ligase
MSALRVGRHLLALSRAQRLGPERLRDIQTSRLRRLVAHAYAHVPFWRRLMDTARIDPGAIRTLEDLHRFPVTTRAELQRAPLADRTSSAFPPAALGRLTTTGSTGRPLTISIDDGQADLRKASFLRALMASGMRPGQAMLLIAHDKGRSTPPWLRWHYLSPDLATDALAAAFAEQAWTNIYGWVTPIRHVALLARERGLGLPRARRVFTTAETLDEPTRQLIVDEVGHSTSAIYGTTELGTIGWECRAHGGLHIGEESTFLEFLPVAGGKTWRVVATSLTALATPFIRYDTGDLATPPVHGRCACGSLLARVARLEGRLVDSIRLASGRLMSPFALTEAIEGVKGLDRYQIVQEARDRILVRLEGPAEGNAAAEEDLRARIRRAIPEPVDVTVRWGERLDPPAGAKFRVVESRAD